MKKLFYVLCVVVLLMVCPLAAQAVGPGGGNSQFENKDFSAPWNDPILGSDTMAPWNDPVLQGDPFAPWNNPAAGRLESNDYLRDKAVHQQDYYWK